MPLAAAAAAPVTQEQLAHLAWVHPGGGLASGSFIPTLPIQLAGIVALFVWAVPAAWLMFKLIDRLAACRVSDEDELQGLDLAEHGIEAYPRMPEE